MESVLDTSPGSLSAFRISVFQHVSMSAFGFSFQLLEREVLIVDFALNARAGRIAQLMEKYRDAPMDLADACLVVMTEETKNCQVITLDHTDFSFYRRNGREVIPFTSPEKN